MTILFRIMLVAALLCRTTFAHGDVHELIEALSGAIAVYPADASLYVQRGELYRVHHDWQAALTDFDKAQSLDSKLTVVDFLRGQTYLDAGRFEEAVKSLDKYLAVQSNDYRALSARAHAHAALKHLDAAIADFTAAIDKQPSASPSLYIDRAQALNERDGPAVALEAIDSALKKLGKVPTLQLMGIEFEVKLQRFDNALKRADELIAQSERHDRWLLRKAEILIAAQRKPDAESVLQTALREIQTLPDFRRKNAATVELESKIKTTLQSLALAK